MRNRVLISSLKKWITKHCPASVIKIADVIYDRYRLVRYKLVMVLHPHSTKFYCPCCGIRLRNFAIGTYLEYPDIFNLQRYEKTKQDVLCPYCKSLPRHRMLASWFNNHIESLRNSTILYFAPEYSMTLWVKAKKAQYITADLYREADLKLDIQATGLPDASYDIIIANHVLEHVDDFRKALREMYRILKPGGSFICSFPMDPKIEILDEETEPLPPEERLRRFGQNDHKRVFGMKADQLLTEAGFEVETIRGEDYPEEILPVIGPADYDMNILFCCRKG